MSGKDKKIKYVPILLVLGAGVGLIVGNLIINNLAMGIVFGSAIGVIIGAIIDSNNKKK